MVMIMKKVAYSGMTLASPPYSAIMRLCRRSYTIPTRRKRAPVEMPWLIICRIEPLRPAWLSANMPIITKPMWLTLE